MNSPELGVGLTWFAGIEPVLKANSDLVEVLEVNPQNLLRHTLNAQKFCLDQPALEAVRRQPCAKLVHSVACSVGGTLLPNVADLDLLRNVAVQLQSPWVSEHLSFSRIADEQGSWHSGFLLPPRQTLAGVEAAVASVRALSSALPTPVAIETGAGYLRRREDELPDGEFVARVAEGADCGILLDLHNVWTNDRNGRQPIGEYLEQLPLERVWELHVAGGHYHHGFWRDVHSNTVPEDLLELAFRIVPRLGNLKAIIFELFPSCFPNIGVRLLRSQLEDLHRLWDRRSGASVTQRRSFVEPQERDPAPSPKEWETTLASLAVHRTCDTALAAELRRDPGLAVIREIVEKCRSSMIMRTLRLSARLIILERGCAFLEQLLASFWKTHPPQPFAVDEADAFATFLGEVKPYVPYLSEVLEYDRAVIAVSLDGEERSIAFGADPLPLLRALGAGRRPTAIPTGDFEVRLTPDLVKNEPPKLSGMDFTH